MACRSSSTARRAALRRGAKLRRLSVVMSSLVGLVQDVRGNGGAFGKFVVKFESGCAEVTKIVCGDLVPIPPIAVSDIMESFACIGVHTGDIATLVNFSLAGINYLYGGGRAIDVPRRASYAQRSAQLRFVAKWWSLARQASQSGEYLDGLAAPLDFTNAVSLKPSGVLVASQVDGLVHSGLVDPSACLPHADRVLFDDPSLLFPDGLGETPQVVRYRGADRGEYAALVATQLRSKKIALARHPKCSANTFVVSKRGTGRLREVWDGGLISAASCAPSAPRWLADPAALVSLEASLDAPLYLSTRDGACFYDQLKLSAALVPYFGRPLIRVSELIEVGLGITEIAALVIDAGADALNAGDWLAPVGLTWPMVFTHSAFVAQQLMTASCLQAGFDPSQFLTSAGPLPNPYLASIAVATDDVNVFTRLSMHDRLVITDAPLCELDRVWRDWGIEPKHEKSADMVKSGALLGVELVNGLSLMPKCKRFGSLVGSLQVLLRKPMASPTAVHSYAGVLQWSCLLNRPLLSSLGSLYEFVEREPSGKAQRVPAEVIGNYACVCHWCAAPSLTWLGRGPLA